MDTSFEYIDRKTAYISSTEYSWYKKMLKLKEEHPDEVEIIKTPEENAGYLYASFPVGWIKIKPKRILSEEEKQNVIDRFKKKSIEMNNYENDSIPEEDY